MENVDGGIAVDLQSLDQAAREAMEQGRIAEAEALLRQALSLDPEADPVRINLAACLGLQGRPAEAESELRSVLDRQPSYLFARALLASLLAQAGRMDEAAREAGRALELALREPPTPEAAEQLVSALALLDHDQGLRALQEPLRPLAPALGPEALHALVLAARRHGEGESPYLEALERHPAAGLEPFASHLEALRQGEVDGLVHLQRWALAGQLREEADRLARSGRLPEAESRYRQVLAWVPHAVGARVNLSNLYRSVGRLAEAQGLLEEALRLHDLPAVRLNLAGVLTERGELDAAEKALNRLDPARLEPPLQVLFHLVRAEARSRAGDHGQALAAWEEAARIDPEALGVRRTRAELDRRRDESQLLGFLQLYQDRRRERLERARVRRDPGPLPPVRECVRVLTPDNLRAVWIHYRSDPIPPSRGATVETLARAVVARLPETLKGLTGEERAILEELAAAGGLLPLERLARLQPGFRQDSWFWERTLPEGPVGRLRFLQVLGFGRLETGDEPAAFLPLEVRGLMG